MVRVPLLRRHGSARVLLRDPTRSTWPFRTFPMQDLSRPFDVRPREGPSSRADGQVPGDVGHGLPHPPRSRRSNLYIFPTWVVDLLAASVPFALHPLARACRTWACRKSIASHISSIHPNRTQPPGIPSSNRGVMAAPASRTGTRSPAVPWAPPSRNATAASSEKPVRMGIVTSTRNKDSAALPQLCGAAGFVHMWKRDGDIEETLE
jgi:hypothetical protein